MILNKSDFVNLFYLYIFQIHFASFVDNIDECVTELNRQVSLGRIRYYGVSNYGPNNLKHFLEAGGKPISNQVTMNLYNPYMNPTTVETLRNYTQTITLSMFSVI
jgi:diketogulonate reductase-like aldo/keto reductase